MSAIYDVTGTLLNHIDGMLEMRSKSNALRQAQVKLKAKDFADLYTLSPEQRTLPKDNFYSNRAQQLKSFDQNLLQTVSCALSKVNSKFLTTGTSVAIPPTALAATKRACLAVLGLQDTAPTLPQVKQAYRKMQLGLHETRFRSAVQDMDANLGTEAGRCYRKLVDLSCAIKQILETPELAQQLFDAETPAAQPRQRGWSPMDLFSRA